jgi:hypothetical protein
MNLIFLSKSASWQTLLSSIHPPKKPIKTFPKIKNLLFHFTRFLICLFSLHSCVSKYRKNQVRESRCGHFLARNRSGVEDLDPVAVGVLDKGESLHATVIGFLHEVHAKLFESRARIVDVRHHDADVAEAAWFRVASVVALGGIVLGAPVVGELDGGLKIDILFFLWKFCDMKIDLTFLDIAQTFLATGSCGTSAGFS